MTVGLRFVSTRRCIVFGGLLTGLGYIVTAFLENITAVVLINGAFVGNVLLWYIFVRQDFTKNCLNVGKH